eukprot:CAMPEP_0175224750 /NCGR_PEP_ID=MMETSP0093-20121207/22011_1 /TAXON_ID=311494 /ORGANISM="Alexandrium monilatum, Strain CCMP3105" /LENGTH=60 /DNA_ID=CAMNT_0016518399 /DNA_START=115 /DNA_END=294 /DNA_ORIENTATION=+
MAQGWPGVRAGMDQGRGVDARMDDQASAAVCMAPMPTDARDPPLEAVWLLRPLLAAEVSW